MHHLLAPQVISVNITEENVTTFKIQKIEKHKAKFQFSSDEAQGTI